MESHARWVIFAKALIGMVPKARRQKRAKDTTQKFDTRNKKGRQAGRCAHSCKEIKTRREGGDKQERQRDREKESVGEGKT